MAVLVLKQCHELRPNDPLVLLHAAKLCFNNLHQVCSISCVRFAHKLYGSVLIFCVLQYDEGVGMARSVIQLNQKTPIIGRGYLAFGIGCCCKASTGRLNIFLRKVA